jgi:hypothetical protein
MKRMKDFKKRGKKKFFILPRSSISFSQKRRKRTYVVISQFFFFFLFLTKEHGRKSNVETSGTTRAGRFLAIHTTRLIFSYQRLGGKEEFFFPF